MQTMWYDAIVMKQKSNPKVKTYCYKGDCEYILTGFHLEQYPVCKICHEEISENLKNSIDSRNDKDEKQVSLWEEL